MNYFCCRKIWPFPDWPFLLKNTRYVYSLVDRIKQNYFSFNYSIVWLEKQFDGFKQCNHLPCKMTGIIGIRGLSNQGIHKFSFYKFPNKTLLMFWLLCRWGREKEDRRRAKILRKTSGSFEMSILIYQYLTIVSYFKIISHTTVHM